MNSILKSVTLIILLTSCGGRREPIKGEIDKTSVDSMSLISLINMDSLQVGTGFVDLPNIDTLLKMYDTLHIDNKVYFRMEGDLLLLENYAIEYWDSKTSTGKSEKLVGEIRDGVIVKASNPKSIRYAIIENSFPNKQYYDSIVKFFTQATKDWERLCNVKFIYESNRDSGLSFSDNPAELDFIIRYQGENPKAPLASAFFPYTPKEEKRVLIFYSFFHSRTSQTGILRHEIGHILGFRHEHIRKGSPTGCGKYRNEDNMQYLEPITEYDNMSVMHYFCGGAGTRHLNFSKSDTAGALLYYPFKK